jgi:hypothetical protein
MLDQYTSVKLIDFADQRWKDLAGDDFCGNVTTVFPDLTTSGERFFGADHELEKLQIGWLGWANPAPTQQQVVGISHRIRVGFRPVELGRISTVAVRGTT